MYTAQSQVCLTISCNKYVLYYHWWLYQLVVLDSSEDSWEPILFWRTSASLWPTIFVELCESFKFFSCLLAFCFSFIRLHLKILYIYGCYFDIHISYDIMLIIIFITLKIHHHLWQCCLCWILMHNLEGGTVLLEWEMNLPVLNPRKPYQAFSV